MISDETLGMKLPAAVAAVIVAAFAWQYHEHSLREARQQGHSDIWRHICSDHPRVGEMLLGDEWIPDLGPPLHCSDFEEEDR